MRAGRELAQVWFLDVRKDRTLLEVEVDQICHCMIAALCVEMAAMELLKI